MTGALTHNTLASVLTLGLDQNRRDGFDGCEAKSFTHEQEPRLSVFPWSNLHLRFINLCEGSSRFFASGVAL